MDKSDFYVTTFCNFAHRRCDGKPIEHECYIIPPAMLTKEVNGEQWTQEEYTEWCKRRKIMRRGVKHAK